MKDFDDVYEFHERFGLPRPAEPTPLDRRDASFRLKFLVEEVHELLDAVDAGNLAGQADALVDLSYVVLGTAVWVGARGDVFYEFSTAQRELGERLDEAGRTDLFGTAPRRCDEVAYEAVSEYLGHVAALHRQARHRLTSALIKRLVKFNVDVHALAATFGLPWRALWDEVHASNMRKVPVPAGEVSAKRGHPYDVVKPEGWEPPDLRAVLDRYERGAYDDEEEGGR